MNWLVVLEPNCLKSWSSVKVNSIIINISLHFLKRIHIFLGEERKHESREEQIVRFVKLRLCTGARMHGYLITTGAASSSSSPPLHETQR